MLRAEIQQLKVLFSLLYLYITPFAPPSSPCVMFFIFILMFASCLLKYNYRRNNTMIYPREHTALLIRHQVCLRLPAFLLPIFIFNIFLSYLILFNFTLF